MRLRGNQNKLQSPKIIRDWSGWLLVVLTVIAFGGFGALIFYLFS